LIASQLRTLQTVIIIISAKSNNEFKPKVQGLQKNGKAIFRITRKCTYVAGLEKMIDEVSLHMHV
jgi:hypothetical protein